MSIAELIKAATERRARELFEEELRPAALEWAEIDERSQRVYVERAEEETRREAALLNAPCPECGAVNETIALRWRHLESHRLAGPKELAIKNSRKKPEVK